MQSISMLKPFLNAEMDDVAGKLYDQMDTSYYFDDALCEICDDEIASTDEGDWRNYLQNNVESVEWQICNFGWEGVNRSLERATLTCMFDDLLNRCYSSASDLLRDCAFNYIWDNYNFSFLPDEAIEAIENLCEDTNVRMNEFCESVKEIVVSFVGDEAPSDNEEFSLNDILATGA